MDEELRRAIDGLADDHRSGASALALEAIGTLVRAAAHGPHVTAEVARALCQAQPSMAPIWNAAVTALQPDGARGLELLAERIRRAPRAFSRLAPDALQPSAALRIVTYSASASVRACLEGLRARADVTVACAEGRPLCEGRDMASALAAGGFRVELFTDAAIALALEKSDAVLVGADSVTPRWFINKAGTGQLAAAAAGAGVPVFVVAARDKLVHPALAPHLRLREGSPGEVWPAPPHGITVRNPS